MDRQVPARIANILINALKGGVVPRAGLEYITVGRAREISAILHDIDMIEEGGASFRFIVGKYGSGKSFLLQTIRNHAAARGFAVVDAGTYFLKPFTHQQMQQCLDAGILNHDILNALDQMCTSYMKEYGSEIYLNMHKICK